MICLYLYLVYFSCISLLKFNSKHKFCANLFPKLSRWLVNYCFSASSLFGPPWGYKYPFTCPTPSSVLCRRLPVMVVWAKALLGLIHLHFTPVKARIPLLEPFSFKTILKTTFPIDHPVYIFSVLFHYLTCLISYPNKSLLLKSSVLTFYYFKV